MVLKKSKLIKSKSPVKKVSTSGLKALADEMNVKFGKNTIQVGIHPDSYKQRWIPTGLLQLDADLGGGIPEGRCSQISGVEEIGKSTLALHILGNAQKMGLQCGFIDIEGTSGSIEYLQACGVDTDTILYVKPDSLEEALTIALDWQKGDIVKFCLFDSIAMSLATQVVLDSEFGGSKKMNTPQQEFSEFFNKEQMGNNRFYREGKIPFTLLFVNQLRDSMAKYGDPEYEPGGKAKEFKFSVKIRLHKGDWIKDGGKEGPVVGQVVKYKITKNKLNARMRIGQFDFYFDGSNSANIPWLNFDIYKDMVSVGITTGVIQKGGAWFTYKDIKEQGVSNFMSKLRLRGDYIIDLRKDVMAILGDEE